jgi:hypothetical protein
VNPQSLDTASEKNAQLIERTDDDLAHTKQQPTTPAVPTFDCDAPNAASSDGDSEESDSDSSDAHSADKRSKNRWRRPKLRLERFSVDNVAAVPSSGGASSVAS